jgi:primosomal protein N' (replication factor Y) (superfamily II helicase)
MTSYLQVALDTPLRRVFDYRPPKSGVSSLQPGQRVRVPFGRRQMVGLIVAINSHSDVPASKLKAAIEVIDNQPIFTPELFQLLNWAADYYRHPVGEVFAAALPTTLRQGGDADERIEQWRMTQDGHEQWRSLSSRSKRLRALMECLEHQPSHTAPIEQLSELSDWRATARELQKRGWVEQLWLMSAKDARSIASARESTRENTGHALTDAQAQALTKILSSCRSDQQPSQFRSWLLHGVTGSGKTEVYLRSIEHVIAHGGQALVLVPEIALTPQLLSRFQDRFAVPMSVLHSGLNDSERLAAWRAARDGAAPIVIGTRSAIFAPVQRLQLIIVDEEHDTSYKQQEGFRYSARDLAMVRAQRLNIPVVLGSATPSLESLARVQRQSDDLLLLPQRAGNAREPSLHLIDLRAHGNTDGIAAPALQAMKQHLDAGAQVLVYLNRRGFAPVLFCTGCGWQAPCPRCDARMTVHQRANKLACHHCGHESTIPPTCPQCFEPTKPVGQGTERVEDTLAKIFPGYTVARIDRDSVRRKGELQATLDQVNAGEIRILVGTQMLAKGHHFPAVSLVLIVNADQGLFGTDFRAAERLAQSIVQVAGRAGRAERPGDVLIQTEFPEHPLLQCLLREGYSAFAMQALQERQQTHWPPFARIALLRAEAPALLNAMDFLNDAKVAALKLCRDVDVLGPAIAPMTRRAGVYRAQLLLRANTHGPLQKLFGPWITQLESLPQTKHVRWSLDVDPIELF